MRVTNKMLSNNFLRDMRTNLTNLSRLQNQMSSGKEIKRPSDDPSKASRIMQMYSEIDANKQYNSNIKNSINWLDTTDTALGQVGNVVGRIQDLLLSAGNGSYGADERQAVKDEINQKVGELSQILNTSFDGKYIFGGTDGTSNPTGTGKDASGKNDELICNLKPKVVTKGTGIEMAYAGTAVNKGDTFNMYLDGVSMDVKITDDIKSGTTMGDAAKILEKSINGTTPPPTTIVTVKANADGRFEISSASGVIRFSDTAATKDLGLVQGPDKLLVEVSQGVTMDYNITASQVINYGTGDENLMKLLGNITSHLDSVKPDEIKELIKGDLAGIKKAMTNVLKLRSEVGSKQNRMESAEDRNVDANFNMTEILSSTEDIDITEKSMEYATMQTIYMASLQTSAKVLQPSLLDYLR
ncbi:MAG: flagellar hook-associated protein FlgL [Clostridium sp.]|uniref:flagellar hook-associated protein FlgL n=1 Tax=Clostridium sp. TaxID=1506 RepID=UPI003D6D64EA